MGSGLNGSPALMRLLVFLVVADVIVLSVGTCQPPHPPPTTFPTRLPPTPPATFPIPVVDEPAPSVEAAKPEPPVATPVPTPEIAAEAAQAAAVAYSPPITLPSDVADRHQAVLRLCGASAPIAPAIAHMLKAADVRGLDWRLLPTIALLESSCGSQACGGNAWGWASCRQRFATFDEGIEIVADALLSPPYAGHDAGAVLCIWVAGDAACASDHARRYRNAALAYMEELNQ